MKFNKSWEEYTSIEQILKDERKNRIKKKIDIIKGICFISFISLSTILTLSL